MPAASRCPSPFSTPLGQRSHPPRSIPQGWLGLPRTPGEGKFVMTVGTGSDHAEHALRHGCGSAAANDLLCMWPRHLRADCRWSTLRRLSTVLRCPLAQHLSKDGVLLTLNFLCPVAALSRSFTGENAVELFIKLYSLFTQPRPRLL